MKSCVLLVALILGVASAFTFTEEEYQSYFTNWVQKYQKAYAEEEFSQRYSVFKTNVDFVQKWNMDPSHTHRVGLNKFADLTNEEYRNLYLMKMVIDRSDELATASSLPQIPLKSSLNVSAPFGDVINWANKGAVLPPKDQGQCGSCWSFSTTGAVEALNHIYTGNLISLSEQNLMDCSSSYGNNGCNGGWPASAMQYIINNNGIDRESDYPYQGVQGSCRFQAGWTGASMKSVGSVQAGNEGDLCNHLNTQPVSVCIDASHQSFQLYTGGIYSDGACSSSNLDHAVLAIGYGSQGGDYFIVQNSWGTGWGMGGYVWMARNDNNMCGIASAAVVPLAG